MTFTLDARLAADSLPVVVIDGIELRLMNDARYWWVLLIPQCEGAQEWHKLPDDVADKLWRLCLRVMAVLERLAEADKMNIAALGNMVRQLHVHIIARHENDVAWPGPIWGVGETVALSQAIASARTAALQKAFT